MSEISRSKEPAAQSSLGAVLEINSVVPEDAMTAGLLGTERTGHGIRIRDDGLVVTIGYVVSEADQIWLTSEDGAVAPGIVIGNDFRSGLALIRPTLSLPGPVMEFGRSEALRVGDAVTIAGSVGVDPQVVEAQVVARQEFAGRWEYLLDNAIFTAPPHLNWSGAALIDLEGRLCGIGSLVIQGFEVGGSLRTVNMSVPVDLLVPVLDEVATHGRRLAAPRPWLGMLVHEEDGELTIVGVYRNCPADDAGLRPGDLIVQIVDEPTHNLGHFFRSVWSLGDAGVDVPLTVLRNSKRHSVVVKSSERGAHMRKGTIQ